MSNERLQRITRLLNKNFYHMTFEDKKKVLSLVVTEKECDDILVHFLATQYNTEKAPKSSGQVYKHSITDELEDIASEYSTPAPQSRKPQKSPVREPSDDEDSEVEPDHDDSDSEAEPAVGSDSESEPDSEADDPEVEYEYVDEEDVNSDDEVEYV